ncbi:hypothetical protein CSKR_110242, partial [Clonorchis sinensis]
MVMGVVGFRNLMSSTSHQENEVQLLHFSKLDATTTGKRYGALKTGTGNFEGTVSMTDHDRSRRL